MADSNARRYKYIYRTKIQIDKCSNDCLPVWTCCYTTLVGDNILLIYSLVISHTSSFKAECMFVCTQTSPQSFSSAHGSRTTPTSAGHVCVHVNYMCRACGVVKPSTPVSSERPAEVHLGFSQVSLAQFLLNVCFIFSSQNLAVSHEEATRGTMSDAEIFKAEKVFIKDSVEGGAGNVIQTGTKLQVSTTRALSMSCGNYDRRF